MTACFWAALVYRPLITNALAVALNYTLGPNLDNQVNVAMREPSYHRFVFEDFAFRRFAAFGERRDFESVWRRRCRATRFVA